MARIPPLRLTLRTDRKNKKGQCSIQLNTTDCHGHRFTWGTGISIFESEWDYQKERCRCNSESDVKNQNINLFLDRVKEKFLQLYTEEMIYGVPTADTIIKNLTLIFRDRSSARNFKYDLRYFNKNRENLSAIYLRQLALHQGFSKTDIEQYPILLDIIKGIVQNRRFSHKKIKTNATVD